MSSPLKSKLDYTSAKPIYDELPEFPESLEGISDELKAVIRSNASQASMSRSSSKLQISRVNQPKLEDTIQKTQAFLEKTMGLAFSANFEEMEPIGNDSGAYQRLDNSCIRKMADKIDAEEPPKPFAKISIGDDGDMIAALSDSDPYIRLDESRPDAKMLSLSIAPASIDEINYDDVLVGTADFDADHNDESIGTEDLNWSVDISEPQANTSRAAGLSVYQVAELIQEFNPENGAIVDFILDLFSKTEKQNVLIAAAMTNAYSLIPKIIPLGNLFVDEMDRNGNNALHVAIANGSVGAIAMLIDAGANLFESNKSGITAYEMMKHEKLFSALQQFKHNHPQR